MTAPEPTNSAAWSGFPADLRSTVASQLAEGESPVAFLQPDLNIGLRYDSGWVVLTDRRLLSYEAAARSVPGAPAEKVGEKKWRSLPLATGQDLRAIDHAGLGTLELTDASGRVAAWRYTGARAADANRFVLRYRATVAKQTSQPSTTETASPSVCPKCGGLLDADGECPACVPTIQPPPVKSLYRLSRFAKPRAKLIFFGFLLMWASTAAELIPPYLVKPFIDDVLSPMQNGAPWNGDKVWLFLSFMFGSAILAWLLSWARNLLMAWVSELVSADLRNETYAHLQRLSLEFFGGQRTGDLIARVSSDTDRICQFLASDAIDFCADVLLIVMTAVILATQNPWLAIVSLAPLLPISWLVQQVRDRLRHGYARGMTAWGEMVNVLADTIPGIRVVKAFAQESRETERFRRANDWVVMANNRANKLSTLIRPTVTLFTELGTLVIYAWGAWLIARYALDQASGVTVGTLTMFVMYSRKFYDRLESMSRLVAAVQRTGASSHRIFEILDRVPSVPEPTKPVHIQRANGSIEFRDVRFRYGKREVIHGVNLQIEPGEMIGLVGPSGAGKSTLVNLVCRFYDVGEGAILVDGTDIRSYPVEEYRANIGIVLQEPFLFFGSVAENIAYGRPNASRGEIITAAKAAHAHEFILRLPDGYDSLVGERGQALSGGERQRISIARALLTDPRILILDEATSALDSETEREIQSALDVLVKGRTTIAIAHRLSTLRKANRLVVVEAGHIVEVGTHDDLLHRGGTYTRLHEAQMALAQQIGIG